MTPEVFAEWFRRQGYRVIRTRSTYWVEAGPRVFQAIPYHWVIRPAEEELREFLRQENAIGLRYSTPMDAEVGSCSYHVVYDRPSYSLKDVDASIRSKVRRGLEACVVGPISFDRYSREGWPIEQDTHERQGRHTRHGRAAWERMMAAAEGLEGFEVWGAEVEGRLAAGLMFLQVDDCISLLYQQSLREFLPLRVNNALLFGVTGALAARPGIHLIHNGLHSLDAPASVDQFKLRLGYKIRPLRQRVVIHPRLASWFDHGASRFFDRLAGWSPESEFLRKAEGLTRFYINGQLPLARQQFPEILESDRAALCSQTLLPSPATAESLALGEEKAEISPANLSDLPAMVILYKACLSEKGRGAAKLGPPSTRGICHWLLTSPGTLVLAARVGGQVVGFTALSDRPFHLHLFQDCRWPMTLGLLWRSWMASCPRWLAVTSLPGGASSPKKIAQIAFTCVAQDYRGRGLGHALKAASIQACRAWGAALITTTVMRDNLEARRLNESFGFAEIPGPRSTRLARLTLDLSATPAEVDMAAMPLARSSVPPVGYRGYLDRLNWR